MPRAKNKVASHRRKKRILSQARGYYGARSKVYTIAKNAVEKALSHAYRDRKLKKRIYRSLWIPRINAAARLCGTTYSQLISDMNKKKIRVNRKVLAELAFSDMKAFAEIVKAAKA